MSEHDPDMLVQLMAAGSELEASILAVALRDRGIPAEVFGHVAETVRWTVGVQPTVSLMVRRKDLNRAREELEAIRRESVDIDWSEVEGVSSEGRDPVTKPGERSGASKTKTWGPVGWMILIVFFFPGVVLGIIVLVARAIARFASGGF